MSLRAVGDSPWQKAVVSMADGCRASLATAMQHAGRGDGLRAVKREAHGKALWARSGPRDHKCFSGMHAGDREER